MLTKLLIAGLLLLAALCVGLLWLITGLMHWSWWWPAGASAFFVLAGVLAITLRWMRGRRAARSLERGLREQARTQFKQTRPDLQPDVQRMHDEFERAVKALKSSKLGRQGRDALYYLPWYAIIGPSGAGKTTALRNSGLRFPAALGGERVKVKGLGGTRNCDWWLSNEAVLLDTAGRFATREEDHAEWLAFLKLLKRHRPRKPLNGLLAAVSIGDVVNASPDEIEQLARQMRERIDEVVGELRVSLPVYVLFTKCDLIEGFVPTFGALRTNEREQVWGFTSSLSGDTGGAAAFEERFDELAETLDGVALARLSEERRLEQRQLVYTFPQQFRAMRGQLAHFVEAMFEQDLYRESAALRGVYFTSGAQQGRPFSLLLGKLAQSLGVGVPELGMAGDQKSYFLRDLFMRVIFEDRDVASASQRELQRQRLVRLALCAALSAFAIGFGLVPALAFGRNLQQLTQSANLAESLEHKSLLQARRGESAGPTLTLLEQGLADLDAYEDGGPSGFATFGMYQGGRLLPTLRRYYADFMRRRLIQPIVAADLQALGDFGLRYAALPNQRPDLHEHGTQYDKLKLHLLLSATQLPREQEQWLSGQLAERWAGDEVGDKTRQRIADRYVAFAQAYEELAFARDADVVRRARDVLTRVPIADHALAQLIDSVGDYHLDLAKLIGHPLGIQAQGRVRGAFTRRGWENQVSAQLSASALVHGGEPWVLGMDDGADRRRQERSRVDELRSLYFQAYVKEWKSFLSTLRMQRPHGGAATLALLTELSSGEPTPIAKLLQQIDENVRLERGKPNKVEQVVAELSGSQAGRFGPRELAAAFEGLTQFAVAPEQADKGPKPTLGHDTYREQVWYVRDALQAQSDNPLDPSSNQARIQSASVRVRALIDSQEIGWRPTFDALLWPPIEAGAQGFIERNGRETDSRWQNEIVQPFERALRGRYPFRSDGADVALDDFDRFYRPVDGALAKYTAEALRDTVRLEGDSLIWGRELGKSAGSTYGHELLDFLARSRSLSAAFYPQGSRAPRVDFEARIKAAPTVASTVLDVGGDRIEYHNGPERWQPLSWPGTKLSNGASLQIRGANIKESVGHGGVWGLFRLIETGVVTPGSGDTFSVSWQLARDVTVTVEFRPTRRESPFFAAGRGNRPTLFQPIRSPALQPPRQILRASR